MHKNGISVNQDELNNASQSWEHSIKEIDRLMKRIMSCEMFSIQNIISLYTAQRLVNNLSMQLWYLFKRILNNIISPNLVLRKLHPLFHLKVQE